MSTIRERFDAVSRRHFGGTLCDCYTIRMVDEDEWKPHLERLLERSFDRHNIDFDAAFTPAEKQAVKELDEHIAIDPLVHRLLFEENDRVVGCFAGMQESNGRYYMMFSIVDPAHQGRGLYSQFLPRLMAAVEERQIPAQPRHCQRKGLMQSGAGASQQA
jgi:ribosomal protein S18 acetylase RimI-like enzyme